MARDLTRDKDSGNKVLADLFKKAEKSKGYAEKRLDAFRNKKFDDTDDHKGEKMENILNKKPVRR